MNESRTIQYLKKEQIDKTKWDACLERAANGLIYGYSYYLDTMAANWDALVYNDYEFIMPLTWKSKWGIKYLYQPFITAQLGIFGNQLTTAIRDRFIAAIPAQFKYIDIALNFGNVQDAPHPFSFPRNNFTLDLNKHYETIYNQYNENTKRNIKKCNQLAGFVRKNIDVDKIISLAVAQMKVQGQESSDNISRFKKLYQILSEKGMATNYSVCLHEEDIAASAVFFYSHQRAYYVLVGNATSGRDSGASHALIDAFIKDHAGKKIILDFEGSDIASLAAFYKGFGAGNEPYPALKINRLPFYLKWLKRR